MFLFFLEIFILLYWFLSSRMDLHHLHTTSLFSPWLSTPNSKVTTIISNCHNAPNYKKWIQMISNWKYWIGIRSLSRPVECENKTNSNSKYESRPWRMSHYQTLATPRPHVWEQCVQTSPQQWTTKRNN